MGLAQGVNIALFMRTLGNILIASVFAACGTQQAFTSGPDDPGVTSSRGLDVVDAEGFLSKTTAGYQGWFAAQGDSSTLGEWSHWSRSVPSANNITFEVYPDTREYHPDDLFDSGLGRLGDGRPAQLFTSASPRVTDLHFRWMKENGIDGAGLQRFVGPLADPRHFAFRNQVTRNVRAAAEAHGRVFYVEYDISGANEATWVEDTQRDWLQTMQGALAVTDSPRYLRDGGKPVVALWGFGFPDRPGTPERSIQLIEWFKAQGCYVVGGVPYEWRTGGNTKPGFDRVWAHLDVIQPWAVGALATEADAASHRTRFIEPDKAWAQQHGVGYQRVIFPGFAWSNWNGGARNMIPRRAGRFFWAQALALRQSQVSAFIAMFDEFDEGTAITKAAEDASMAPVDQYFLTLDADGTRVSSDFYLRLAGAVTRLLNGSAPVRSDVPVPPFEGSAPPSPPPNNPPPAAQGSVPVQLAVADSPVKIFARAQAELVVQRLYRAILGRDVDPSGLGTYAPLVEQGRLGRVINALVLSSEFEARRGSLTPDQWSVLLYQALLDRNPDPGGGTETSNAIASKRAPERIQGMVLSAEYEGKN